MFEETGDEEKSQGWTALVLDNQRQRQRDDYVEPDQAVDPTKDKRINAALYSVAVTRSTTAFGALRSVSLVTSFRLNPGSNPARNRFGGGVRAAIAGLWAARRRHRPQWRVLGIVVERTSRQLRPAQVQGPAERTRCHGKTLSGRLDLYPMPGPQMAGVRSQGLLKPATTPGWISSTRSGWAKIADRHW